MANAPRSAQLAEALGTGLRAFGKALPGLLGWALVSFGAWLWWPPAGFMAAGLILLADRVWEQAAAYRRRT